jgi:hypothetical protein
MATANPKKLYQGQPGTGAAATVYTALVGGAMITTISMCNTTANAAKFRLHIVPAAGAAAVGNAVFYDYSVGGNDTPVLETAIPLASGDMIQVTQTTASAITLGIFGLEVS